MGQVLLILLYPCSELYHKTNRLPYKSDKNALIGFIKKKKLSTIRKLSDLQILGIGSCENKSLDFKKIECENSNDGTTCVLQWQLKFQ